MTRSCSRPSWSPPPARPNWPSWWRTPSATSISHWSTSWPCSPTTWTSTSGSRSRRRRPSRSGSCRSPPAREWAGHCLPIDPSYLSWQVERALGKSFRFVELADDINRHMPDYVVNRIMMSFNAQGRTVKGSRILLLGLAYKKNTGDARESPAVRVSQLLGAMGAHLRAADPYVVEG